MANINSEVKVLDMENGEVTKISYKGAKYELTEEKAKVGDILFNIREFGSQLKDSYYKVEKVDVYARVRNDDGGVHGWKHAVQGTHFKIFRKQSEALREGDYIEALPESDDSYGVTNTDMKLGKVVRDEDIYGGIEVEVIAHERSNDIGDVYPVLPKYFRKADDETVAKYVGTQISEDTPKIGDYVKVTKDNYEHREGDVLEILKGDPYSFDYAVRNTRIAPNKSFGLTGYINGENIEPVEFIEGVPKIGDKILINGNAFGTSGKYAEGDVLTVKSVRQDGVVCVEENGKQIHPMEFEILDRPAEQTSDNGLQVGDYARFVKHDPGAKPFVKGDVVKVVGTAEFFGFKVKRESDGEWNLTDAENIEKVDNPFEIGDLAVVAEDADAGELEHGDVVKIIKTGDIFDFYARRIKDGETEAFDTDELLPYEMEDKEIQVGDKVALAIPKGKEPRNEFGEVKNGDYGVVTEINRRDPKQTGLNYLRIDFESQSMWNGYSDEVIIVEKAAKPEPVEVETFEDGDTVEVIGDTFYGDLRKGTVATVTGDKDDDVEYRIELLDGSDYDYAEATSLKKVDTEIEVGDIVRVLSIRHTASRNLPGDIGIVESKDSSGFHVNVEGRDIPGARGNHHVKENLQIIAKKSDRKDVI